MSYIDLYRSAICRRSLSSPRGHEAEVGHDLQAEDTHDPGQAHEAEATQQQGAGDVRGICGKQLPGDVCNTNGCHNRVEPVPTPFGAAPEVTTAKHSGAGQVFDGEKHYEAKLHVHPVGPALIHWICLNSDGDAVGDND